MYQPKLIGGGVVTSVVERLRTGVPSRPPFDPRSRTAYALICVALACGTALFWMRGFRFDPRVDVTPATWTILAIVSAWLSRRVGHESLATALETTGVVYAQGFAFLMVIYPLASFHLPFVDDKLAYLDRLLAFHWPSFAELFRADPELTGWAKVIYKSFAWQPALVTISLSFAGLHTRAWQFVTTATVSLCITALVGSLLPADTAVVYFHTVSWPELVSAWKPSVVIHALRSGARLLTPSMMTGLIAFPSYHACAATIFAWALWPIRFLRWPAILLNIAVSLCAIVIGAHYLVDIIAGILVAGVSVRLAATSLSSTRAGIVPITKTQLS